MNLWHSGKPLFSNIEKSSNALTRHADRLKITPSTNEMGRARAICEEFSDTVLVESRVLETDVYNLRETEEIQCSLDSRYFSGLLERMLNVRYCCTKAKREQGLENCLAWFEPQNLD